VDAERISRQTPGWPGGAEPRREVALILIGVCKVVSQVDEKLSKVSPPERVLLLSHCLRPSQACPGKVAKRGLVCPEGCTEECVLGRLRQAALALGYKGVCIASGGAMALKFVVEQNPRGIVAIACNKELAEGVEAVQALAPRTTDAPAIVVVPLLRDGCVDTEVDEAQAIAAIAAGCDAHLW